MDKFDGLMNYLKISDFDHVYIKDYSIDNFVVFDYQLSMVFIVVYRCDEGVKVELVSTKKFKEYDKYKKDGFRFVYERLLKEVDEIYSYVVDNRFEEFCLYVVEEGED